MDDLTQMPVPELIAMAQGGGNPPAEQELVRRLADDPENSAVAAALKKLGVDPDPGAAGAENAGGGASGGSAQGEQTWLVQAEDRSDVAQRRDTQTWIDVGTVVVPPRTKRKTIVEKALAANSSFAPEKSPGVGDSARSRLFRVLDGDSAEPLTATWEIPPAPEPVLRIG